MIACQAMPDLLVTHTYAFSSTTSIGSSDTEGGMNRGYLGWAATMIISRLPVKVQPFLQIFSYYVGGRLQFENLAKLLF